MPKVVIIGGGVAGMSAAHELIERGFQVDVYEKHHHYAGGKARSVNVPNSNQLHPDKYLPGEHGFRFFPGFYKHVIDTMKRIPFTNANGIKNENGVFDNLVGVGREEIARFGKKPIITIVNFPKSWSDIKTALDSMHANTGLTDAEKEFFAIKIWQLMTSCYERRQNEYERIGWWQFMEADRFSKAYQSLLVEGLTRTLVAANAKFASTKTGGDIFLQLIFNIANPGVSTDRLLNGPTNDVWINPWLNYLLSKGVKYNLGCTGTEIIMNSGSVSGIKIYNKQINQESIVTGDYYLLATPIEVAAKLINNDMLAADPTLASIQELAPSVAWMNGLQFYLSEDVEFVRGHCIYSDSEWALTSISQLPLWNNYDIQNRGNGKVKSILSVDISNWEDTGLNGKKASDCTYQEIRDEVWAQLKKSLNNGTEILKDDMIIDWYLDRDIKEGGDGKPDIDKEPLLVNTINSWDKRPEAYCGIPNLFLASDYVRTFTDLATMEGANEAARRAVNNIIDASGSKASLCEIWNLHEPDMLAGLRNHDQSRYNKGMQWQFYETPVMKAAGFLIRVLRFFMNLFKRKPKSANG
ncbi:MAG TPA: FAD-dependent oxidoreductase [Chitinophagaceae bacterium]|nr:FAD-dependent oxidoreductase [Chitinophagaceae bacterium]